MKDIEKILTFAVCYVRKFVDEILEFDYCILSKTVEQCFPFVVVLLFFVFCCLLFCIRWL